ncbi:MAG: DUF3467 domain-containing protein [candidate division Zixibacteria bacterium]|nr:DUF3467 domain-containing protein [candidate division Zixibacteria bacterium]
MKHGPQVSRGTRRLEGRYANYFKIGYNAFEFVLDFGQSYPEGEKEKVHTRIVTSPNYAKALLETLGESIERYEETFGIIEEK